jgi:hypothetical protein
MTINAPTRNRANAAFPGLTGKEAAAERVKSEIAAQAAARDANMERLKQLRLARDAQAGPADRSPPAKLAKQKPQRRPGTMGRG